MENQKKVLKLIQEIAKKNLNPEADDSLFEQLAEPGHLAPGAGAGGCRKS